MNLEETQDVLTVLHNIINYKGDWHNFSKYQFKQALDTIYEVYNNILTEEKAYQKLEDVGFDLIPIPLGFAKTIIKCQDNI